MTKMHMNRAAELVKAILDGKWTNEPPTWADRKKYSGDPVELSEEDAENTYYTRAVQTAEAFIMLFRAFNDRFDEQRFLIACGLAESVKKGKRV